MKVSDLAEELGLPTSAVLEQCQRFSIQATWAGADLSGSDVVVLRAELATSDDLDLTEPDRAATDGDEAEPTQAVPVSDPADDAKDAPAGTEDEPDPKVTPEPAGKADKAGKIEKTADPAPTPAPTAGGEGGPAALPPTAVGSLPGIIDEITPAPEPEEPTGGPLVGGFRPAGFTPQAAMAGESMLRTKKPHAHYDRGIRNGAIAWGLALALLIGANFLTNAWPIAVGWLLAAILLISAILTSSRAWYRTSTHPDTIKGMWYAVAVLVVASLSFIAFGLGLWTVVRSDPASSAPLGLGEHASIGRLRWAYDRLTLIEGNGWDLPAKRPGTCWREETKDDDLAPSSSLKRLERTTGGQDVGQARVFVDCDHLHDQEVLRTWTVTRDADAPYPNQQVLLEDAQKACQKDMDGVTKGTSKRPGLFAVLVVEFPLEQNWVDGDHDLACLAGTAPRTGSVYAIPKKAK